MNRIEIVYENKAFGSELEKEFASIPEIEFIDRTKKDNDDLEAENIDDYLPQPRPIGNSPDLVLTLNDFVVGFVVAGGYDLLKLSVIKAVELARKFFSEEKPEGIKIITNDNESMIGITFTIPYSKNISSSQLEVLTENIKEINSKFREFTRGTKGLVTGYNYQFKYEHENGWKLNNPE